MEKEDRRDGGAEVIRLVPPTVGDAYRLDPREILAAASKESFERVVVIGHTDDGNLYVAQTANTGETMVLLYQAQHYLVFGADE